MSISGLKEGLMRDMSGAMAKVDALCVVGSILTQVNYLCVPR